MKEMARNLLIISMLLSGTQVITLPYTNLSLFQLSLIVSIVASIVSILLEQYISVGKYLFFCFLFFTSSFLAYHTSINQSWAKSYLLLGILTSILIFIFPNFFEAKDVLMLEKMLIRSQYITIPFSLYSFYMFYFKGGLPSIIKLPVGMSVVLDTDTITRARAAGQLRLMLPYATPPVLSIAMAICIVLLIYNKDLFKDSKRYALIIIFTLVLLLTGSRSGIIGLVFTVVMRPFIERRISFFCKKKYLFIALIGIGAIIMMLPKLLSTEYIQKLIMRFTSVGVDTLLEDRHLLIPLDGLILWVSSIKNFFLGIGFGSSLYLEGAHTYLPPYFLNIYVTLIAERGIMGLLLVMMLVGLLFRILKSIVYKSDSVRALGYCLLCGMLSGMFYESLSCYMFIYLLAICYLVDLKCNNRKNILGV